MGIGSTWGTRRLGRDAGKKCHFGLLLRIHFVNLLSVAIFQNGPPNLLSGGYKEGVGQGVFA
jgi:hypothetical protein